MPTTEKRRHDPARPKQPVFHRAALRMGASVSHEDRTDSDLASARRERREPKPDGPEDYRP